MRALCFFLPLIIHALPADLDGDGWPDVDERAKGFDPQSSASHPPAPRYAPVDLGAVAAHGVPVALSASGHRVLTAQGVRWSWQHGWEKLDVPEGVLPRFAAIRPDGAVLAPAECLVDGMPGGELWSWDASGAARPVPGTRYNYLVFGDPSECLWEFEPIRWLRGDDFLVRATPITLEPAPIPVDVLVISLSGAPRPLRRLADGAAVADGAGGRWVRPCAPEGEVAAWRLEGAGRGAELGVDVEPLALSDDSQLITRSRGRLYWHPALAAEPIPLAGTATRLALTCDDASEPCAVELGAAARVWSLADAGPSDRLADLVDPEEPWVDFSAVAADDHGAILAVGSRIRPGRMRRDAQGLPLKSGLAPEDCEPRIVLLVPIRARCDHDRAVDADGLRARFPMGETGATPPARPLRLWLNDDHDDGDLTDDPDSDLPGARLATPPNWQRGAVGGMSDLVDWFPVCLRLGRCAADLPPFRVRLLGASLPINAIETGLPIARASQYLQRELGACHGPGLDQRLAHADKSVPGAGGLALSEAFARSLVGPRPLGEGEATFLLEGRACGEALVWVYLVRAEAPLDRPPAEGDVILRAPLRVVVAPVEDFYRKWDAREARLSSSAEPPALPDRLCPGPWLVFAHGFNVDVARGRAWGAEIFKRMYQAGSRARYVAFRWFGDQGSANYAMAVECAPAAADRLAAQARELDRAQPGRAWVLLGHSLGGYVAALAGRERLCGAVDLRQIVLVDAALTAEALDPSAGSRVADYPGGGGQRADELMVPFSGPWRASAPWSWPRARASAWASLFPPDDLRSTCAWKGRLPAGAPVLNLYSRTEDVLMPAPADPDRWPGLLATSDHGAWIYEETHKGRWQVGLVNADKAQGGWALASGSSRRAALLLSAQPDRRDALLRSSPLFTAFRLDAVLLSTPTGARSRGSRVVARRLSGTSGLGSRPSVPAGLDWTVRDELLAHAIPALANPVGSTPLAGADNYRMDGVGADDPPCGVLNPFPLGWPRGVEVARHLDAPAYVWRHSDWKNVAFPYVHPVFARIGLTAGLTLPEVAR